MINSLTPKNRTKEFKNNNFLTTVKRLFLFRYEIKSNLHISNYSKKWTRKRMEFERLCRACGLFPFTPNTKKILAAYLNLSVRQVERYISGENKVHPSAVKLLETRAKGIIDLPDWEGFMVRHNELVTPYGESWPINDLKSRSLFIQLLSRIAA